MGGTILTMKSSGVYLPLEIYAREYLSKMILAVVIANENIAVSIGNKNAVIRVALKSKLPGVFFEKSSKADLGMAHLEQLKKKFFKIVAQDEESGISFSNINNFATERFFKNINFFDKFFCWGKRDFDFIESTFQFRNIELTGSPRTVLWGDLGYIYWERDIVNIKAMSGEFILIVSNLSFANGILTPEEMNSIQRQFGGQLHTEEYIDRYSQFEYLSFMKVLEIIQLILDRTSFNVIVRLHPTEKKSEVWENVFGKNGRVIISSEGEVDPYVLASNSIIHTSSTVAYQAIAAGIPTYSIDQFISLSENLTTLPNSFSIRAENLEELCLLISQNTKNSKESESSIQSELIHNIGSLNSVNAITEVIKDLIEEIECLSGAKRFQLSQINFLLRIELAIRSCKAKLGFLLGRHHKKGKINFNDLGILKRPEIKIEKIKIDIEKICHLLMIKNEFIVQERGGGCFLIFKTSHQGKAIE